MARGNRPLEVRLDDATRERWTAAARDAGYSLSEYVRVAVDDLIERETLPPTAKPKRKKPKGAIKAVRPTGTATGQAIAEKRVRTAMCEHRVLPNAHCKKCDP